MPSQEINQPDRSMSAGALTRALDDVQVCALVRGFLIAVESGRLNPDGLLTVDQVAAMEALAPVIDRYWDGA